MKSADELTQARQENLNRVSEVVNRVAARSYESRESIALCTDTDRTTGRPDFTVNGTPADDAAEYVKGELAASMKADGWALRDRSQDDDVHFIWDRDDTSLSVWVRRTAAGKPSVSVAGVGPCGKLGDLRHGQVRPDSSEYLEPSPPIAE